MLSPLLIVLFPYRHPFAKSRDVTCARASGTCVFLHAFPEAMLYAVLCISINSSFLTYGQIDVNVEQISS